MGLQTAGLCYVQPLKKRYIHLLWIFFWDKPFLPHFYEIYLPIKDSEIFAE